MTYDLRRLKFEDEHSYDMNEVLSKMPAAYDCIIDVLDTYMDMDENDKKIVALWMLAACTKDAYLTMPLLYINASKQSGKTRLLKIIDSIVPKSTMSLNLSDASLYRLCEIKQCLCIDEAEHMGSKEKATLREMLGACYKKGGKVIRVEKETDKKARDFGRYKVKEFNIYEAVALANVWGLESVIEDRCIKIVLQKSSNRKIMNTPELFQLDGRIEGLQKYLNVVCAECISFLRDGVVEPILHKLNTYIIYTYNNNNTINYTNIDVNDLLSKVQSVQMDGRSFELWLPIFITAALASTPKHHLFDELIELAKAKFATHQEEDVVDDLDTALATAVYQLLGGDGTHWIETKDIAGIYNKEQDDDYKINSKTIGRFLKRADIVNHKRRAGHGFEYQISMAKLKKYLDARGALFEAETQTVQPKGQADLNTTTVPRHETTPSLTETGGGLGVCELCGKSGKLYEYDNHLICADCLTLTQHAHDTDSEAT